MARAAGLALASARRQSLVELDRSCSERAGLGRLFRRSLGVVRSCADLRGTCGSDDRLGHEGGRLLGLEGLSARGRPWLCGGLRHGCCRLWLCRWSRRTRTR